MPTETNRDMRAKPETIGRMPRTASGLSDDDWNDVTTQETAMIEPPEPWAARINEEPIERETWGAGVADYWQDVRPVVLCAGFIALVLAFASHVGGFWGQ